MEYSSFSASMFVTLIITCISLPVRANLPLALEDVLTDKGKTTLETTFSYANHTQQGIATDEAILVQTGPTSFINIPTRIGETQANTDNQIATAGLRYGLTQHIELYGRSSYLWHTRRSSRFTQQTSNTRHHFLDAWIGVNYRLLKQENTPALLGFVELALAEQFKESRSTAKSWLLGATSYQVIDPIVLTMTAAYRLNQKRDHTQPGNFLLLNPSLTFATNDRISLTASIQWLNRQPDQTAGLTQHFRHTTTDLTVGLAYGFSQHTTLSFSLTTNVSGSGGTNIRMNWLRTLTSLTVK